MARTVVIVDDSAPFRAAARAVLEARGYTIVRVVADAAAGLAAVRELRPDAVLLDVNLPDLDGISVARRLAADGEPPVVVLVSTLEAACLGSAIASSGARGFVNKVDLGSDRLVELLGPPDGG